MPRGTFIATALLCAISITPSPLFASPNPPSQINSLYTVSVTFVDELGHPLNGSLWARGISNALDASFNIDITNGFCQFIVPPGAWVLQPSRFDLSDPGAARSSLARRLIVTNSIETHFVGHPNPPPPLLVGRLLDENDQPIPNTFVEDSGITDVPGTTTAADGSFTLPMYVGTFFSLSISNSKYIPPQLRLSAAPGSVIHKTLHAHKITSHIQLRASILFDATATTHVGPETFKVTGVGNGVASLGVFDGEWTIRARDIDGFNRDVELTVVVPSTNNYYNIKFTRYGLAATLRGKLVDESGAPFRSLVYVSNGSDEPSTNSAADGSFTLKGHAGDWNLGVNVSPRTEADVPTNYTRLDFYFPATFPLTNGQTLDLGTLIVPQPSAHLTINLVDATGQPLNIDDPYFPPYVLQLIARQTNVGGHSFAYSHQESGDVQTNKIVFDILPGRWTFEATEWISFNRLNEYGYASFAPFSLDLHPGDNEYNLRIDLVPSEPAPALLTAAITAEATPHFQIFQPKLWPVDIESSTDLVHWQFYTNAFFNNDFAIGNLKPNLFYRAVQSP